MLDINSTVIVQILNLVIFFIIFVTLLYKPLMNIIKERQEQMIKHVEEAERVKNESIEARKQYLELHEKLQSQGASIIKDYKDEGERIKNEQISQGKQEARRIIDHANAEIEHQKEVALQGLKEKAVELAIKISEKALVDSLDVRTQQLIIDRVAEKVRASGNE
ncbi:MAG: F0F1 ATP synthase subunit B [Firmicutes bacterium]|nr:F0F1 ATP synthase subunit B [Bacillota bacterium]